MKKIVIHNPISIFFHMIPAQKKKKIITIQVNKDEAKDRKTILEEPLSPRRDVEDMRCHDEDRETD
ncbi:hypothetical protein NST28_11675 [Paenibacillus sp. FSL R10-2791]|uniref:hypothetical protein n=1 Tax=Paenibacillus TaxID=44249 RepID=UPI0012D35947|nr:hypothetical protein [Paenibacillus odorifer]